MFKTTLLSLGSVILLGLSGCAPAASSSASGPAVDTASEASNIREHETAWVKDIATRDVEKWASHYTDDAVVMAPGMPPMKGKDAIREGLKHLVSDPNIKLEFTPDRVEVSKSGDVAYTRGTYQMTMTDPKTRKPVTDKGTYVTVYRKQPDGSWKAAEDINTSQAPPTV